MSDVNLATVEKYQKMYQEDPNSKVFAPLSEAYRKMGLMKEARQVAEAGVRKHPDFPGGRIALARVYLETDQLESAITQLQRVTEVAPDNVLALSLLGDIQLRLKRPKEALKAFKMLLFIAPENAKAMKAVQKLESLTADEYEDEVFQMKPLKQAVQEWEDVKVEPHESPLVTDAKKQRLLERILSVADAHTVRNDHERALETLNEGERLLGPQTEIVKRLKILHQKGLDALNIPRSHEDLQPPTSREELKNAKKLRTLQSLLHRFQSLKTPDS